MQQKIMSLADNLTSLQSQTATLHPVLLPGILYVT